MFLPTTKKKAPNATIMPCLALVPIPTLQQFRQEVELQQLYLVLAGQQVAVLGVEPLEGMYGLAAGADGIIRRGFGEHFSGSYPLTGRYIRSEFCVQ